MRQTRTRRTNESGEYLEPEALAAVTISSDDDTDSSEESDCQFDFGLDPDVHMHMVDDVDALDGR